MLAAATIQKGCSVSHGAQSGNGTGRKDAFSSVKRERVPSGIESGDGPAAAEGWAAPRDGRSASSSGKPLTHLPQSGGIKPFWWALGAIVSLVLWYGLYRLLF